MVRDWMYAAAAMLTLIGIARIIFLFLFRIPVQARLCGVDLTEMQRHHDGEMHWMAHSDGALTPDDVPVRRVTARVAFRVNGTEYREDVTLFVQKGDRADAAPVIWYDPADPRRVTGLGIGPALAIVLAGAGFFVLAYHLTI